MSSLTGFENPPPGTIPAFGPPFVRFVSDEFARLHRELASVGDQLRPYSVYFRKAVTGIQAANGLETPIVTVDEGFELAVGRVYVSSPGGAGDSFDDFWLYVEGQEVDSWTSDINENQEFPFLFKYSNLSALVVGPGETLSYRLDASAQVGSPYSILISGRQTRSRMMADSE